MPATRQDIPSPAERLNSGINAFDELAATIANPPAGRPLREAIGKSGQKYCDFYGALPQAAKDLLGPGYAASGLLCKPYWDSKGYSPPGSAPPFSGGQCNTGYYQYFEIPLTGGGYGETSPEAILGPISSRTQQSIGNTNQLFTLVGKNGMTVTRTLSGAFGLLPRWGKLVRIDNLADNCGSLPSNPVPGPSPPPTPTFPPGGGPGVGPDGRPYFTVPPIDSPSEPGTPIDVPTDPFDDPFPFPPGEPPGEPEAGPSGETGDGGDEEGEAPEGKELWALRVDINSLPVSPNEYSPGVYRGVCYVYMGDANGLDHDPAGAMMRSGQLVLAEREGLTKWRVSANLGYNLTITPFYRTPRSE